VGTVAVVGEEVLVAGYGLAGALVLPAANPPEVHRRWTQLDADISVVILTPASAAALAVERVAAGAPLTVVLPAGGRVVA
jgi:hypothetical protein